MPPTTFAAGSNQELRVSKESTWNIAPGTGTGRQCRRTTCDLSVSKDSYQSPEIVNHRQVSDLRHGQASSKGTLTGPPVPGAHSDLIASAVRKAFVAGSTTGAIVTVTAAASAPHFVRSGGSFLSDGFKIGDVIRWSGWATTGAPNNARNYMISALTATQMTVVDPGSVTATVAAKAAGDSVTCAVYGKKTFIPTASPTDESWSFERWFPDISRSRLFTGVKAGGLTTKFTNGAMGEFSIPLLGSGWANANAAYFSAPTAVSTTGALAGANAGMMVAGSAVAYIRDLSLTLDNGLSVVGTIGSNAIQAIVQGTQKVTGSLTAYFVDEVMLDYFLYESTPSLIYAAFTGTSLTADFMQYCMPYTKLTAGDIPDGNGVIAVPISFQALYNGAGGTGVSSEQTTLSIQDSLA